MPNGKASVRLLASDPPVAPEGDPGGCLEDLHVAQGDDLVGGVGKRVPLDEKSSLTVTVLSLKTVSFLESSSVLLVDEVVFLSSHRKLWKTSLLRLVAESGTLRINPVSRVSKSTAV